MALASDSGSSSDERDYTGTGSFTADDDATTNRGHLSESGSGSDAPVSLRPASVTADGCTATRRNRFSSANSAALLAMAAAGNDPHSDCSHRGTLRFRAAEAALGPEGPEVARLVLKLGFRSVDSGWAHRDEDGRHRWRMPTSKDSSSRVARPEWVVDASGFPADESVRVYVFGGDSKQTLEPPAGYSGKGSSASGSSVQSSPSWSSRRSGSGESARDSMGGGDLSGRRRKLPNGRDKKLALGCFDVPLVQFDVSRGRQKLSASPFVEYGVKARSRDLVPRCLDLHLSWRPPAVNKLAKAVELARGTSLLVDMLSELNDECTKVRTTPASTMRGVHPEGQHVQLCTSSPAPRSVPSWCPQSVGSICGDGIGTYQQLEEVVKAQLGSDFNAHACVEEPAVQPGFHEHEEREALSPACPPQQLQGCRSNGSSNLIDTSALVTTGSLRRWIKAGGRRVPGDEPLGRLPPSVHRVRPTSAIRRESSGRLGHDGASWVVTAQRIPKRSVSEGGSDSKAIRSAKAVFRRLCRQHAVGRIYPLDEDMLGGQVSHLVENVDGANITAGSRLAQTDDHDNSEVGRFLRERRHLVPHVAPWANTLDVDPLQPCHRIASCGANGRAFTLMPNATNFNEKSLVC